MLYEMNKRKKERKMMLLMVNSSCKPVSNIYIYVFIIILNMVHIDSTNSTWLIQSPETPQF